MVKKKAGEGALDTGRLLTIAEVAQMMSVSRTLIYWLVGRGDLRTVHIGRALRFRAQDVQSYIQRRATRRASEESRRKKA